MTSDLRDPLADVQYIARCEERALRDGLAAYNLLNGTYQVMATTGGGGTYTVLPLLGHGDQTEDGFRARFACTCPAGQHMQVRVAVPCKHAACVARRLEREHALKWSPSGWVLA